MSDFSEAAPLWPDAPRYCPDRPFPSYRFMPGHNPHPNRDPKGHSYGHEAAVATYMPPERWSDNSLYLYGVDLYNQSYFWEAHEAWEILWHLTGKGDPEGQYLQGLIQNSAAQLKRHLELWPGMAHLGQEAFKRIQTVAASKLVVDELFMGLNVGILLQGMKAHYESVWNNKGAERPDLNAPPPLLVLNISV